MNHYFHRLLNGNNWSAVKFPTKLPVSDDIPKLALWYEYKFSLSEKSELPGYSFKKLFILYW